MKTFRLLYFRDSVLEQAQEVRVRDVVEAVQLARGQPGDVRVEAWCDQGRAAIIGPASSR